MQRKRRIVWLIDSLRWGGAEAAAVAYAAILRERHSIHLGVFQRREGNPLATRLETLGLPVDEVPVGRLRNPTGFANVLRYVRANRAELVHTHLQAADILGTAAARLLGIPSVSTRHALDEPVRGAKGYWRLRLLWATLRRADRVIAVSEFARREYVARYGIDPKRTLTIHNGIDVRAFTGTSPGAGALRRSLGVPEAAPILMTVSVLREEKGIQDVIGALPTILASVPEVRYVLVGGGRHEEVLRRLVRDARLDDHVVFAGARHDVAALLGVADVFVLPTHADLLPTVLMEAMAAERPIVATAVGGIPEMIDDGRSGILVGPGRPPELGAACVRFLRSPSEAGAMAREAREAAWERFDIDRQAELVGDLYEEILGS